MWYKSGIIILLLMISVCWNKIQIVESSLYPSEIPADPKFSAPISNVTAAVGREAILTCTVHDLGSYKVAWLHVGTQTILTIQNLIITKNHRVGVTYTEKKTWQLRLKDIRESDEGWYMCQINTDPMKSQTGYLDVVVPPDILDHPTSTDMVVREGSNVTLQCSAKGSPAPQILWRREDNLPILVTNANDIKKNLTTVEGPTLTIVRVDRLHMGAYLCIASNGVPPSVSKRIKVTVEFPPMISVPNQLVGAVVGQRITLECLSEAYPKSINYWTRDKGEIVSHTSQDGKFEPTYINNSYRVVMKLMIGSVSDADFGTYKCVAKNSLGDTDGTIKLYKIPRGTLAMLDSFSESHRRGSKSRKENTYYGANDVRGTDEAEIMNKRKDLIPRNPDEYSNSASLPSTTSTLLSWTSLVIFLNLRFSSRIFH